MYLAIVINPNLPTDIMSLLYIIAVVASIICIVKAVIDRKIDGIVITIIACCILIFLTKNPSTLLDWGENIIGIIEHIGGEIVVKK